MTQRTQQRHEFLKACGYDPTHLSFLASDMSPRQYYRLSEPARVIMDSPVESPGQFIRVAHFLRQNGLRAPEILDTNQDLGLVILEDFGNATFRRILTQTPSKIQELYTLAVDVLKHLHKKVTVQPDFLEPYNVQKFLQEVEVFIDWVWPATFGFKATEALKKEFLGLWNQTFLKVPPTPCSLVLRDYHVDNLMIVDGKGVEACGVLDFQDALFGPVVYDLISLLEDARYHAPPSLISSLWDHFLQDVDRGEHANYTTAAAILGTGRHVKILGVFTRYAMRQGKKDYLNHVPRLWRYLENHLSTVEALAPLKHWFDTHFPQKTRQMLNLLKEAA
jgi:aminoglycoside/choline kinase family phosphotransferase